MGPKENDAKGDPTMKQAKVMIFPQEDLDDFSSFFYKN